MFDFLQWNCKGLRARFEALKVLMREYNPGVVCLQETMLGTANFNPGLNYKIFDFAPPVTDRAHGGAAIIVKKSLRHSVINLNSTLQAVAIRVILDREVTVCSLYLPPNDPFLLSDIQNLIDELPSPFLILGDFNAHNPLWGGDKADSKGEQIEDLINSNAVNLFNDGSMTFHSVPKNQLSAIDLTIGSSNLFLDFEWSVNEYLNGSDHFPIHLKFLKNTPSESPPKWKVEKADWCKYSQGINLRREFDSFPSHIEAYDYFTESTLESAEASIPKTKGKPHRPAVPWWNKTCSNMRKITRKCYKKYKSSGSPQSKVIYQRNLAKQRRYYKKAKRESWLYYINGINSKTPMRVVWKKVRKLRGKFVPSPLPSLKINGSLITNPNEVAEKLGEHFAEISSASNYSPRFRSIRDAQVTLDLGSDNSGEYNAPFFLRELKDALSSTEATAPGEDTILYEMLKHLPDDAKKFLLKIINKIWETGILPKSWKISVVIPVKKPNKNAFEATSYRPIALTSCICKLMEKMINTRLVWYLETKKIKERGGGERDLLSPFQFGFRRNRSTLDPLLQLSNQIQQGFAKRCQTIGVFFDLEKAYDTTWRHGIVKELKNMGICGNMIRFIHSFLTDRYIKVRVGNNISSPFYQEEGVPQGSVLSVTCFAVAINNILNEVPPPVKGSLFVDDLAIYCTGYDAKHVSQFVQRSINAVSKWADDHGFKFSTTKTVAVRFTRSRRVEEVPTLTLNGSILPYEEDVKFLGMIFDSKLTWEKHIDVLKGKVNKSLNILKVVSSFSWGADKRSLLRLYDSLCRSKLDYGCQIYSSACKTLLNKLDVVHNTGLRICSGAFKTSPIESIYVETGQLPLDLRREELAFRYMMRVRSSANNPSSEVFEKVAPDRLYGPNSSKPLPTRLEEEIGDIHLKSQEVEEVGHPEIPPWLVPKVSVCDKCVTKKDTSTEEIREKFLEHDVLHKGHTKLYTDGSKSGSGVGCAVIYEGTPYTAKLPDSASIFTAELTAVGAAMDLVNHSSDSKFVIYSDSWSTLEAIKQFNSFHPLVQKIQEWLFWISCRRKSVHFCWVPSHVGIWGNEVADREAKAATLSSDTILTRVPQSDLKSPIRSYILSKWQGRWSSLATNQKYKNIRDTILPWPSSFNPSRRVEIILCRLRIGHTHLTHSFMLKGVSAPECAHCDGLLSVEHILVHCSKFLSQRRKYHLDGKSVADILGDDVNVDTLVGYLQDIEVFHKI